MENTQRNKVIRVSLCCYKYKEKELAIKELYTNYLYFYNNLSKCASWHVCLLFQACFLVPHLPGAGVVGVDAVGEECDGLQGRDPHRVHDVRLVCLQDGPETQQLAINSAERNGLVNL